MIILKFPVHTAMKSMFFQRANYSEPAKYEEHYNNDICERENIAIENIINSNIDDDITIVDIGCGTGLGKKLINNPYIGIDRSKESIEFCKAEYPDEAFFNITAEDFIRTIGGKVNPLFLFSMDYLSIKTIRQYIEKTDTIFISVHYNKPYLSRTSIYSNKRWLFNLLHRKRKRKQIERLFKENNAITFKLLNEEYYSVSIIKK